MVSCSPKYTEIQEHLHGNWYKLINYSELSLPVGKQPFCSIMAKKYHSECLAREQKKKRGKLSEWLYMETP